MKQLSLTEARARLSSLVARQLRCPLITADELIQDGDWIDTIWD